MTLGGDDGKFGQYIIYMLRNTGKKSDFFYFVNKIENYII